MKVKDVPGLKHEIGLIPAWSVVLAVAVFLFVPFLFAAFGSVWSAEFAAPLLFKLIISFLPGMILGVLALAAGYVNRDAGRRGMSRTLWTLLVVLIPNAIGFILYFIMRSPVLAGCPKCGTMVNPNVNFCPRCRYNFHPTCPQCRSTVKPGDTFCTNCGAQIDQVA